MNKFLFIILFIAYQATGLYVLTGSTEMINFQKAMGPDMMHLPYSCLCFCESFNWLRMKRSAVKIVSFFVNSQDNVVKRVDSPEVSCFQ